MNLPVHQKIKELPEDQRPREKLLAHGPQALADEELLAIFLRTGIKGKSVLHLAQELLAALGGLHGLFTSHLAEFEQFPGMGPAKYAQVHAVLELARRYLQSRIVRGETLTSPDQVREYLALKLRHLEHEVFACIFLDNRHRVIEYEELFIGTIDATSVYPREILKRALHHNAAAIIFAHNHPSGVAEPSQTDIHLTDRLKKALDLIDVRVLDHLVIGESAVSFRQRGLL